MFSMFKDDPLPDLLITTTDSVEGRPVLRYLGVVSGEAILGANAVKDFFASITDIVGGRSAAYEKSLRKAKEMALREMLENAAALGANAVIGVDMDYEALGQHSSMLMVSANGTAVVLE